MAQRSGVVVVGSANVDVVLGVDDVPRPGETVLARSRAEHVGGKGLNQAVAAARCGAATTFVGAVGDDAGGRRLRQVLADEGVDVRCRVLGEPSGTAFITVAAAGENAIVVDAGANAGLLDLAVDELDAVRGAGHLLCQLEVPLATVVAAARAGASSGAVVVLNPSPVQELPADLLAAVDVLLVNEHEAAALAGRGAERRGQVLDRVRPLARRLLEDVPAVVVTLGAQGALVAVRDAGPDGVHVPGLQVGAVDTTGAGDVFSGALVAELEAARGRRAGTGWMPGGAPVEPALVEAVLVEAVLVEGARFATAAAALSVQASGAATSAPCRADVEALLAARGAGPRTGSPG